jgi:hypothetical protein
LRVRFVVLGLGYVAAVWLHHRLRNHVAGLWLCGALAVLLGGSLAAAVIGIGIETGRLPSDTDAHGAARMGAAVVLGALALLVARRPGARRFVTALVLTTTTAAIVGQLLAISQ